MQGARHRSRKPYCGPCSKLLCEATRVLSVYDNTKFYDTESGTKAEPKTILALPISLGAVSYFLLYTEYTCQCRGSPWCFRHALSLLCRVSVGSHPKGRGCSIFQEFSEVLTLGAHQYHPSIHHPSPPETEVT